MSIGVFTVLIMIAVAYAFLHEGVATSFCMFCNVVLAGLIAWNFWEPIAGTLDEMVAGGFLEGYEDFLTLTILFALSLGLLRLATNTLLPTQAGLHVHVQAVGSGVLGLLTGYLVAGFLTCALQTLPWHERFMQFDPRIEPGAATQKLRRYIPPDRVWLAMMQWASEMGLSADGPVFDPDGTFEQRYARHRRYNEDREALPPSGETEP